MRNCENCWFYCHSNSCCYADPRSAYDDTFAMKVKMETACLNWVFDGLEDWEREAMKPVEVEVMA